MSQSNKSLEATDRLSASSLSTGGNEGALSSDRTPFVSRVLCSLGPPGQQLMSEGPVHTCVIASACRARDAQCATALSSSPRLRMLSMLAGTDAEK